MAVLNAAQLKELKELGANANGIVAKDGGFEATYTSRILVIGLGGMGLKTMRRLKRELKERVGDISGSCLQILSIDTDSKDREEALTEEVLTPAEIPLLQNTNITNHLSAAPEHRPASITAVIPDDFKQALNGMGANQVRLAGRLTLMDLNLFRNIFESIRNAILSLRDFTTATLDVHVVAGLGGGSGSGMIIDIPYIVRAVVQKLGLSEARLRLFGHLYLPNSYSGISNPSAAYRNGYAALKEVDYYMNLSAIGESFEALYPDTSIGDNGRFVSDKNLFSQCTLIGGKIAGDIIIPNPQQAALAACVEDLVTQCTSVKYQTEKESGSITDFFSSESFNVNADTALMTVMSDPNVKFPKEANYHYQLIGATSIKFPTDAITNQFIGEIAQRADAHMKAKASQVTEAAVDAFEAGLIKPTDLVNMLSRNMEQILDGHLSNPDIVWEKKTLNDQSNRAPLEFAVSKALNQFDEDKTFIERIKSTINAKAREIFVDPERGPYYLEALLTSNNNEGGVHGFYQRIGGYFAAALGLKKQSENRLAETLAAQASLGETMQKFGHFKSNLPSYLEALKQQYVCKFRIALCDRLTQNYYVDLNSREGVAYTLKFILDSNFLANVDIMRAIHEIMIKNKELAADKLGDAAANDPTSIFALQDPNFETLKSTVRNTVSRKLNTLGEDAPKNYVGALATRMMDNRAEWELTDRCEYGQSKCAEAYRNFVKSYAPFNDIVNRKMLDYFNDAYASMGDGMIAKVISSLLRYVEYRSAPMCNVWDDTHFNFESVSPLRYSYLVLPDGFNSQSNVWGEQFNSLFVTGSTKNIYWSPDQDGIYCYTLYTKMPIWIHQDLIDYEREYEKLQIPGVHINESPKTQPRMKDYPALYIPSQWYRAQFVHNNYTFKPEEEMMKKVATVVRYAIRHGLIRKPEDRGAYEVCTIQDKPNPNDGRSKERIDNFMRSYTTDDSNRREDGAILVEKNLFAKMCDRFGAQSHTIFGGRSGFIADSEENVVLLLRKQMKLLQILMDEIDYYKKNFAEPLESELKGLAKQQQIRTFAKYMLLGLIVEERNIWRYKLGDQGYPILARAEAAREHLDYMEMAANDVIWGLEDMKAHSAHLDRLCKERVKRIAYREDDNEPMYLAAKERHAQLQARFQEILDKITDRYNMGNELKQEEIERRKFYSLVLDEIDEQMRAFG